MCHPFPPFFLDFEYILIYRFRQADGVRPLPNSSFSRLATHFHPGHCQHQPFETSSSSRSNSPSISLSHRFIFCTSNFPAFHCLKPNSWRSSLLYIVLLLCEGILHPFTKPTGHKILNNGFPYSSFLFCRNSFTLLPSGASKPCPWVKLSGSMSMLV